MVKKIFAALLGLSLAVTSAGCSGKTGNAGGKGIKVVCLTAPLYDWARQITKDTDSTDLSLIIGNGTDLHSFQPSAADIVSIKNADVLVYVGGESDGWIRDALKETANKNQKVVCLMDVLKDAIVEEEVVEGMQGENEEEHEEEGPEYDEHVWLSLRLASKSCVAIEEAIASKATKDKEKFKANLDAYTAKLSALDKQYEDMVKSARLDTMVVLDRYPFRYLGEDYKLKYSAAFVGCSAETEASFETVKFLADKIKELDCKTVLTIEKSDGKIAKTVIETAGMSDVKVEVLDSMQSCGKDLDYLAVMTSNLAVLKDALA